MAAKSLFVNLFCLDTIENFSLKLSWLNLSDVIVVRTPASQPVGVASSQGRVILKRLESSTQCYLVWRLTLEMEWES